MKKTTFTLLFTIIILLAAIFCKAQTVTDFDGNEYETVAIGEQTWLKENLKSLHYYDGTPIEEVLIYDNNEDLVEIYGRLYTWNSAMKNSSEEGAQGACPVGWHVPTDSEWTILGEFLGGDEVAGGKLKEAGTEHWNPPNTGATNQSGFSALPAGEHDDVEFRLLGEYAVIWSSTQSSSQWAKYRYLSFEDETLHTYNFYKSFSYSIRCIKNETTGKEEESLNNLKIYPNPFDEKVLIRTQGTFQNQQVEAALCNQYGQFVCKLQIGPYSGEMDLGFLKSGVYYLSINLKEGIFSQKLVKK